jgi:hypothetical protein
MAVPLTGRGRPVRPVREAWESLEEVSARGMFGCDQRIEYASAVLSMHPPLVCRPLTLNHTGLPASRTGLPRWQCWWVCEIF